MYTNTHPFNLPEFSVVGESRHPEAMKHIEQIQSKSISTTVIDRFPIFFLFQLLENSSKTELQRLCVWATQEKSFPFNFSNFS